MFNIGFGELVIIGVIALIFIGPEQLPQVARSVGRLLNEFRRAGEDFKGQFVKMADDTKREAEALKHQVLEKAKEAEAAVQKPTDSNSDAKPSSES